MCNDTLFFKPMIVYYFRNVGDISHEQLNDMIASMPQQQQEIVARYKTDRQKCEQVLAYMMLCHAIDNNQEELSDGQTTITEFQLPTFNCQLNNPPLWASGEHGKPYIVNREGVYFNISHCREAVAVGVSDHELGIDIEGRRKFSDTLLQRAFNDEEQKAVNRAVDPEKEFARIWTRKEAWFKYTGTGILMDHLKTTESEAQAANCQLTTTWVDDIFWLSVAQSQDFTE